MSLDTFFKNVRVFRPGGCGIAHFEYLRRATPELDHKRLEHAAEPQPPQQVG